FMLKRAPQTHLILSGGKFMTHRTLRSEVYRRVLILSAAFLLVGVLAVRFAGPHIFIDAHAQNEGTRLLRSPTVSETQFRFAFAQNIWVVPRAGGMARRITSVQGQTSNTDFSTDGKCISLSGEDACDRGVIVDVG